MTMKKLTAGLTLAVLLTLPGLSVGASAPPVQPRLIPLTDFFRNPDTAGYALSPDGEHIAFMKPWENRLIVYVRKIGEQAEHRLTDARERDLAGFAWANNNRIVYIQDSGGDENYRLYAVNIDGSGLKELTPFEGVRAGIVDRLEENDDEMLISLNRRDPKVFDVYRLNINFGAMELVAENPGNVSEWLTDNDGQLRVAVTTDGVQSSLLYRETEKDPFRTVVSTDFMNTLDPLFFSFDNQRLYVASNLGRDKTAIYLYDVKVAKFLDLIYEHPEMADVRPIQFTSCDGLIIHGYLTLPKGAKPVQLPIVVNPHGGPWVRDVWGFDPETQFLANRGVGFLQINFRGSTGYGKAFWEAGFKQWGGKMQDDITDGVQWLIKEGIADPKRIGIHGASYGGYAALAGLAFTLDLYACGVDYVGMSNIFTLLETLPPYWELGRQMMYEMVGDPVKDRELLKQVSPVFHAANIKVPLLVAQGANDPRVKKAESDQIVQALRQRGVDVEYIVKDNEGHGFHNEENRFDFYRRMEGFLARHLGSRAENPPPA